MAILIKLRVLPILLIIICRVCSKLSHGMTITFPSSSPSSQQLDEMFSKGLLARPRSNLYVLGTVHIGSKSSADVQLLIDTVKPTNVIVEVSPSRLIRIQQRQVKIIRKSNKNNNINNDNSISMMGSEEPNMIGYQPSKPIDLIGAILCLPALASEGYAKGGISGFIFSTTIVWSSLVKRSITTDEENKVLPRTDEFEAAIMAAKTIRASVTPADIEFEELIKSVAKSMTPLKWINLGINVLSVSIGFQPADPVRRGKGESIVDWESRRRDVNTARASRIHGEKYFPEITQVIVQHRDIEFARLCVESDRRGETTVCVVGLVHLDGILDKILSLEQ